MNRTAKIAKALFGLTLVLSLMTSSYNVGLNKNIITTDNREIRELNQKMEVVSNKLLKAENELSKAQQEIRDLELGHELLNGLNLDMFKVTAYSPYDDVNGINSDGDQSVTSTGATPGPGTIAVNPEIIPYGSNIVVIYEDGTIEVGVAEDTGGALRRPGNKQIDVFRYEFAEASRHGVRRALVIWD